MSTDAGKAVLELISAQPMLVVDLPARSGITVPDRDRARIVSCPDVNQLEVWLRRSATIDNIDDLFE
jgi:hypothetical protein